MSNLTHEEAVEVVNQLKVMMAEMQQIEESQKHLAILHHFDVNGKPCLCSGWKIYPDGELCSGCSDCEKREGFKYYGRPSSSVNKGKTHIVF